MQPAAHEETWTYSHYAELATTAQRLAELVETLRRENDMMRDALATACSILREREARRG